MVSFILTVWYVNALVTKAYSPPISRFILTMWYVNMVEACDVKVLEIVFYINYMVFKGGFIMITVTKIEKNRNFLEVTVENGKMYKIQVKFSERAQISPLTLYYYNILFTFFKARNEKNSHCRHFL